MLPKNVYSDILEYKQMRDFVVQEDLAVGIPEFTVLQIKTLQKIRLIILMLCIGRCCFVLLPYLPEKPCLCVSL